ncbi:MAG: FAD-binding oxidoreductase [bacterium]|nr:FAD-binding oxidoreductase [bacterium]
MHSVGSQSNTFEQFEVDVAKPYWWEDSGELVLPPECDLPEEVDVLIVGAGLTGLSAARTLAKAGKQVITLDSGIPGIGASSRNGGMIGGGHRFSVNQMQSRYGVDMAVSVLREAHLDSHSFAISLMAEEVIECDYTESGRFRALWRPQEYEPVARELESLQKLIPVEAEMLPKNRQHEEVATDIYHGGVVYPRHGGLNPAKWVIGIMQAAIRAGAQVQGNTPVEHVARKRDRWEIRTPRGSITAASILVATNGYTPSHLNDIKRRLIPVPSYLVATEAIGTEQVRKLFPNQRMIVESRDRHCYYRPSPDGSRIVFGGRAATCAIPFSFAQHELRGLIGQIFPELKDIGFTHCWTGNTGFTFEFLPNIGQIDGIWHVVGYSGSGNQMAPYLGHKAALQLLGDPEGETAFSKTEFSTRWWHQGIPWFLPFSDVIYRIKDGWNNIRRNV